MQGKLKRRMWAWALLLLAITQSACAADSLQVSFEYATTRGSILLHVRINDKPALLILDTGSSHTIIRPEFLRIPVPELLPVGARPSEGGFMGDAIGREVALLVGNRKWPKRKVAVMDLSHVLSVYAEKIDGVLGLDFLYEFTGVTINVKEKTIVFVK